MLESYCPLGNCAIAIRAVSDQLAFRGILEKKGYDTDWIHQRLLSIRVRNELTAEWQERGVQQGKEYVKQKETADQGPP